ncbi:MAG: hypothetical protein QXO29_07965 [Nitrososphaerota archaeon]
MNEEFNETLIQLKAIATAITNNREVIVDFSNNNTYTDFKKIYIGINDLPKGFQKFLKTPFIRKILNGLTTHESGHIVFTKPINKFYESWINRKDDKSLAKFITNLVEDKRVDYFISKRYRLDLADDLKFSRNELGKSYATQIENAKLSDMEKVINYVIFKTLYNMDIKIDISEYKKEVEEAIELLENVKSAIIYKRIIDTCERLYYLFYNIKGDFDLIPNSYGGSILPIFTDEQLEKIKEEMEKIEMEEKAKRTKEVSREIGAEIPAPEPNVAKYLEIYERVKKQIDELLDYLKRTQNFDFLKEDYQKHGRLMNKIISKIYPSSLKNHVENIYTKNIVKAKEEKIYAGIIVDLSGSMNIVEAKESLTILAEAMSRWLTDSEFSILVYGTDFLKLKTFYESYNNVKYRIGGLRCLDSTYPIPCLKEMCKLMRNLKGRKKIIITVSDFEFVKEDFEEFKRIVKETKDITFINLCYSNYNIDKAREITKNSIEIEGIHELPKKFFEIYRTLF